MVMNKSLQEINVQNMNIELVAQMFKNYQSNVLFHLEGNCIDFVVPGASADTSAQQPTVLRSHREQEGHTETDTRVRIRPQIRDSRYTCSRDPPVICCLHTRGHHEARGYGPV